MINKLKSIGHFIKSYALFFAWGILSILIAFGAWWIMHHKEHKIPVSTYAAKVARLEPALSGNTNKTSASEAAPHEEKITPTPAIAEKADPNSISSFVAENLIEASPFGPLPIIGTNGLTPFVAYKNSTINRIVSDNEPIQVSIVLYIKGNDPTEAIENISKIPPALTMIVSPYIPEVEKIITILRSYDHEILLGLPAEPLDYPDNDPGPHTLMAEKLYGQVNLDRLLWCLSRATRYCGVANIIGSRFCLHKEPLEKLLQEIKLRGLCFLDGFATASSLSQDMAENLKLPYASIDVVLDTVLNPQAIQQQLQLLAQLAQQQGKAIAIAAVHPMVLESIIQWQESLGNNLKILPASCFVASPKPTFSSAKPETEEHK